MAMIVRLFVILLGFAAASLAASLVIVMAALYPEWSDLQLGYAERDWIGVFTLVGFVFVSGFALIPALVVIVLSEAFAIRAVTFFAAAGALIGALVIAGLGGLHPAQLAVDSFSRRELELMIGAGIVGGLVYWIIAGRSAGNARTPKPSAPAMDSSAPSEKNTPSLPRE